MKAGILKKESLRKAASGLLCFLLASGLTGCAALSSFTGMGKERYEASFMDLFDTVTVIRGYADSQEEFTAAVKEIYGELERYHELFDIYNTYDGVVNLKTLNDLAGKEPVEVSPELMEFLQFGKEIYIAGGGKVNIFMGSVLRLWHEAREISTEEPEKAYVPETDLLAEAALHVSPDSVILDKENNTVFFTDPDLKIDAGAVAKGYAAQKALAKTPESFVCDVGGNICVSGPKPDGSEWTIGIQDPDSDGYAAKLSVAQGSVVTSGDYQRYFEYDGIKYHHIIDPDTLMPADRWRSVTIVAADSGIADFLSTALFLMDEEEGTELLKKYGAEAYWIDMKGITHGTAH